MRTSHDNSVGSPFNRRYGQPSRPGWGGMAATPDAIAVDRGTASELPPRIVRSRRLTVSPIERAAHTVIVRSSHRPRWGRRSGSRSDYMSVRGRVIGPALVGLLLLGCTGGGSLPADRGDPARATVRVASFDFPESRVLAEIYATALQVRGYPVTRTLGLGSREVVEPA